MSYLEFQNKYMIITNVLAYFGIVGAVPKGWKTFISEYGMLHDIENDIVDRLKSDKKPCTYFNKGNAKRGVSPRLKIDPMTLKINRVPYSLKD